MAHSPCRVLRGLLRRQPDNRMPSAEHNDRIQVRFGVALSGKCVRLFLAPTVIVCGLTTHEVTAIADTFDGTYVGRATNTRVIRNVEGRRPDCARRSDIRITVSGPAITSEDLSTGIRSTGMVQSDGSFTAQGALGPRVVSTSIGRIQGRVLTGEYSATTTGGMMCEGTLKATRQ